MKNKATSLHFLMDTSKTPFPSSGQSCFFHTEKVGAARSLSIIMFNKFYFIDHISLSSLKVDRSVDWSIAPLFVGLCIEMFIFALFISFHFIY